jgi:hypothetical protein
MKPTTPAGKDAVRMRGLFAGETEERAASWVALIEEQAVAAERDRIKFSVRVSRSQNPVFAWVEAYGLGQVIQGKPWPEDS